jgi:GNAT superfamily N-acetyltransferase
MDAAAMSLQVIGDRLPDGFPDLLADSLADGYAFIVRLQTEWALGQNRFDAPGERLVSADIAGRLAGIGGLNIDPYVSGPRNGRIRHLYVHRALRRRGIAAAILADLIAHAGDRFDLLSLRTANPAADLFYRRAGFAPVRDNAFVTHRLRLVALPLPLP